MPLKMVFTAVERERLGILVNNLGVYAAQVVLQTLPEFSRLALANLARVKKDDEALLKRLDEVAQDQADESPLRLIEDLTRLPSDLVQMMTIVRRCLLASAFLGHCLAQPIHPEIAPEALGSEKRVH